MKRIFVVARSTSSLLAVRGAAKAFCAFVAGGASWPATASRLVRAVDLRGCVKNITLWYQVPHLRVALSDSGRCPHRRHTGCEGHGRFGLSSRPCYGWLPTSATSEFVNESPSRVRRGRRSPVLQTCSLTGRRGLDSPRANLNLSTGPSHRPSRTPT